MADTAETNANAPQPPASWRDVWQLPAIILAGGLFIAGAYKAFTSIPAPDFRSFLTAAEHRIEAREFEPAIELLNAEVFPYVGTEKLSTEERGEFHRLMARALSGGQNELGISREDNNRNIIASYLEAETLKVKLTSSDLAALADAYIAVGEFDRARRRADEMPPSDRARRVAIYRRLAEAAMRPGARRDDLALELVTGMLTDPDLAQDDRAWALARQAEIQIDKGFAEEAINRLLRELPRLDKVAAAERGTLHLLLGRGYLETLAVDAAAQQLDHAATLIEPNDPRRAQLDVMQGEVLSLRGENAAAREKFEGVIEAGTTLRWLLSAELGLGQSAAATGDDDAARKAFDSLADRLLKGETSREVTPTRLCDILTRRADERFERDQPELALRFAALAERVIGEANTPAPTILRLAQCHRRLADDIINSVKSTSTTAMVLAELDPATRAQARSHLMAAGSYFRRHSDLVVLTDVEAYSRSLWEAGDAFDRAGDQESAMRIFQLYASERADDPRQPEARFRLAQSYQARGDLENAAAIYRDLTRSRGPDGAGPFADLSAVPLARCMLLDASPDNDAEAEQILRQVTAGATGGPNTPSFREAVLELANHFYRRNDFDQAIERFDEAVRRYPTDPQAVGARFKLADSMRLSVIEIDKALQTALPPVERIRLERTKEDRLRRAMDLFESVRRELDAKDDRRRTGAEETFLRNSYFYLGECAFRLRDYEAAIQYYNQSKDRYAQDPASLVAMTQVVSCHLRQNDLKRARAANERAKRFYASLPAAVWDDPTLPMTRQDWERWLEATARLWKDDNTVETAAGEEAQAPE